MRADGIHQIAVRRGIPGHHAANHRPSGLKRLERARERRIANLGELEHHRHAVRAQHAPHLAERRRLVREVAHAERHQHRVKRLVGERQRRRVHLREIQRRATAVQHAVAAGRQHFAVDVGQHHLAAAVRRAENLSRREQRHIARARRQIEHALARPQARHFHGDALHQPMAAERHDVVHGVVAMRDGVEHAAYATGLLRRRNPLGAEVDRRHRRRGILRGINVHRCVAPAS